jgi:hypothetical protein
LTDKHDQSFFGKASAITLQSTSKSEPFIFFKCIKKKPDNKWEKPSKGEGKTIKCSIDEIIMILEVLKKKSNSWSSYHSFNDIKTPISFKWEDTQQTRLWINIGSYSKMLSFPQTELLKLLLKHILKEKIEFATKSQFKFNSTTESQSNVELDAQRTDMDIIENSPTSKSDSHNNRKTIINGSIKAETEKALLLILDSGKEIWIPKSIIYSDFKSKTGINQSFLTENWILEKNSITA